MDEEREELLAEKILRKRRNKESSSYLNSKTESFKENTEETYISPFEEDYDKLVAVKDEEEEEDNDEAELEEDDPIIANRVKFFLGIVAVIYFFFLGIGWYMTAFSDEGPQVLTFEDREQQVYLANINDYLILIQQLHADAENDLQLFEDNTLGREELAVRMQKIREKIQTHKKEIMDTIAPKALEGFQTRLNELYSVQLSLCAYIDSYANGKTEKALNILRNGEIKYEMKSTELNMEYDSYFRTEKTQKEDMQ